MSNFWISTKFFKTENRKINNFLKLERKKKKMGVLDRE